MEERERKRGRASQPVQQWELIPSPGLSPSLVPALPARLSIPCAGPWSQLSRPARPGPASHLYTASNTCVRPGTQAGHAPPRPVRFPNVRAQGHHHEDEGGPPVRILIDLHPRPGFSSHQQAEAGLAGCPGLAVLEERAGPRDSNCALLETT